MRLLPLLLVIPASTSVLLLTGCGSRSEPSINLDDGADEHVVTLVHVARAPVIEMLRTGAAVEAAAGAVGRTYRRVAPTRLAAVPLAPPSGAGVKLTAARDMYFDLWQAADELQREPGECALRLSLLVRVRAPQDAWLGAGWNDTVVVAVNGRPVFGSEGARDSRYMQNLIRLPLVAGENRVTLVCQKAGRWSDVPANHFANEWAVNLQLFRSAAVAWHTYRCRNYHPLDTPIVATLDDFRSDVVAPGNPTARLYDAHGIEWMRGRIADDGRIGWSPPVRPLDLPFVGWMTIGGDHGEAVVVDGGGDWTVHADIAAQQAPGSPAWAQRLHHLLDPAFRDARDVWWARKVALAWVQTVIGSDETTRQAFAERCPAARIDFAAYRSRFDGTTQYYRVMRLPRTEAIGAFAVVAPTVPSSVRPYLESYSVADLKETESLASVAAARGVDLVWAGGACVDYGGLLARNDLAECVADYRRRFDPAHREKLFVVGFCSSGVGALGFAANEPAVCGVVLWSPVVNRRTHRWFSGLRVTACPYPPAVLADEQTNDRLERYRHIPVYLLYDCDAEGHGDRAAAKRFMDDLTAAGGKAESRWLEPPEPTLVWGLRAVASADSWMQWIAAKAQTADPPRRDAGRTFPPPTTVQAALLNGVRYRAPAAEAPAFDAWLNWWRDFMAGYRGAPPAWGAAHDGQATELRAVTWDRTLLDQLQAGTWVRGRPLMKVRPGADAGLSVSGLWGFRLISDAEGAPVVEIVSPPRGTSFPTIDPTVDGCCRGALWQLAQGQWHLMQVWL